jgi:hypothetical protein
MSWTKRSERGWIIAEETITITAETGDQATSVIDFLPYGKDFYLWLEHANTLSATGHIDLQYSDESDGTFTDLATAGIDITAAAQSGSSRETKLIDTSAKGNVPYLRFNIDKDATMAATADTDTITFTVLVPPANGVVY